MNGKFSFSAILFLVSVMVLPWALGIPPVLSKTTSSVHPSNEYNASFGNHTETIFDNILVFLEVSKTEVSPGESISIIVGFINLDVVDRTIYPQYVAVIVYNETFSYRLAWAVIAIEPPQSQTLHPGQSYNMSQLWDFTAYADEARVQLQPGAYSMRLDDPLLAPLGLVLVPEFPSLIVPALFLITMLLAITIRKKKHQVAA